MSWETVRVQDIAEVFDGPHATPPKSDDGPIYLGIPSILPNGGIDYENSKRISYADFPKWTKRVTPRKDDVVFSYEANLESYAIIPEGFEGCLGRRMALMRPDTTKVNPRFLFYYMSSPQWRGVIAERTVLGATVNRIPIATFPQFPIELPPLGIQERIASILMAYDNLIENNRKQIALLEEAAQRLYKEWYVDLRYPSRKASVDRTSWTQLPLTECASIIRGRSYTSAEIDGDEGIALVNLKNLRSFGGWNGGAEKTYTGAFKEEQHVRSGDIIMGVTDMTKERRLVGHVALVPDLEREAIISMDLVKLIPKHIENLYLYAHLRFSGIAENIALLANGTNVLHLKPQILTSVLIPIPSQDLQSDFARHMAPMVDEINLCSRRITSAQEARDRLLPKLMSGEIEVEG